MSPSPEVMRPADGGCVLVIGAGLAGLLTALHLAPLPVLVVAPNRPGAGGASSGWAQGGIAAALGPGDTPASHAADTIAAGAGLVNETAARILTEDGPAAIHHLAALGTPFDRDEDGGYALSLEAAHSAPRVARVGGDSAGREIMRAVGRAATGAGHITALFGARAVSLVREAATGRVCGAVIQRSEGGQTSTVLARAVVLATGGSGALFPVTTNPAAADGAAMALAAHVGAIIADPEFLQFHPTGLDVARDPAPLASEALRGEGAVLVDRAGRSIVEHPAGALAPRDIVARAVHQARADGRGAFLDAREAIGDAFAQRFPTVFAACQDAGLDPRREPVPVAPAAHYHMGGVETDVEGRSSVAGLWAVGEAACNGVHGANRLASNSLLEAAVFARRAAVTLSANPPAPAPSASTALAFATVPPRLSGAQRQRLRSLMGAECGVVRDAPGLHAARQAIANVRDEAGPALALTAADLIVAGALARTESRGAHFRTDTPHTDPVASHTSLALGPDGEARAIADRPGR